MSAELTEDTRQQVKDQNRPDRAARQGEHSRYAAAGSSAGGAPPAASVEQSERCPGNPQIMVLPQKRLPRRRCGIERTRQPPQNKTLAEVMEAPEIRKLCRHS